MHEGNISREERYYKWIINFAAENSIPIIYYSGAPSSSVCEALKRGKILLEYNILRQHIDTFIKRWLNQGMSKDYETIAKIVKDIFCAPETHDKLHEFQDSPLEPFAGLDILLQGYIMIAESQDVPLEKKALIAIENLDDWFAEARGDNPKENIILEKKNGNEHITYLTDDYQKKMQEFAEYVAQHLPGATALAAEVTDILAKDADSKLRGVCERIKNRDYTGFDVNLAKAASAEYGHLAKRIEECFASAFFFKRFEKLRGSELSHTLYKRFMFRVEGSDTDIKKALASPRVWGLLKRKIADLFEAGEKFLGLSCQAVFEYKTSEIDKAIQIIEGYKATIEATNDVSSVRDSLETACRNLWNQLSSIPQVFEANGWAFNADTIRHQLQYHTAKEYFEQFENLIFNTLKPLLISAQESQSEAELAVTYWNYRCDLDLLLIEYQSFILLTDERIDRISLLQDILETIDELAEATFAEEVSNKSEAIVDILEENQVNSVEALFEKLNIKFQGEVL
ncbi:MAG: hypothetical protein ACE5PV_24775 [Candidatus Poribacteria bacterium]